jgi:hypothetical protein
LLLIVRFIGAVVGLVLGIFFVGVIALAFGISVAASLFGGLFPFLPTFPSSSAGLVLLLGFWLLVTQVIGWYAIASLSLRLAVVGAISVPGAPTVVAGNLIESFARGYTIGLNAGLNLGLWVLILPAAGIAIGVFVGLINFLASIGPLAALGPFQFVLGWASWVMPMSWPATTLGFILFIVNLVTSPFFGGVAIRLDGTTGTVESAGGITGITGCGCGFNLGNFTFLAPGATPTAFGVPGLSAHETGHTLNVAAFGSIWHLLGNAPEESVPPFATPGVLNTSAYGEMLAESHLPRAGSLTVLQWS